MATFKYIRPTRRVFHVDENVIDPYDDPATWWDDQGNYVPAKPHAEPAIKNNLRYSHSNQTVTHRDGRRIKK